MCLKVCITQDSSRVTTELITVGNDNTFEMPDFHVEMERKLKMNW